LKLLQKEREGETIIFLAGLNAGAKMRALWQSWKRIASKIGDAQARIILTVFYFVIVGPFAIVIRFWSDPLRLKDGTGWIRRSDSNESAEKRAREQF
jgi:hypothetical protein